MLELNVALFYANWQSSQKNDNIRPDSVRHHEGLIDRGEVLDAITIEKIEFEGGTPVIRTADGRHRLTAAYNKGLATIRVVDTEVARQARDIFGL